MPHLMTYKNIRSKIIITTLHYTQKCEIRIQ